jgi:murein L,D-transpeptidase YcbB/YkuD
MGWRLSAAWCATALVQFPGGACFAAQLSVSEAEQSAAIVRAVAAIAVAADRNSLQAVYGARRNAPLWHEAGAPTPQAAALVRGLRDGAEYGLRPEDYSADSLAARLGSRASAGTAASFDASLDVALSQAALHFLNQLHGGRVDPRAAGFNLRETRAPLDAARLLQRLAADQNAGVVFSAAEPQFHHYALLKQALTRYRALAADATLTVLPPARGTPHVGGQYPGAPALRRLLTALGDLPDASAPGAATAAVTFDAALAEGLRRFQARHGLDADGLPGKRTMAALTTPLSHRVRQIELTLERWRWLPTFKSPPIIVNIPQFRLFAFRTVEDRAADIEQMPVIVGEAFKGKQTPIFLGDMQYIVFRPYWDVPREIAVRELLPKLQADAGYAGRNHLELVRGAGDDSPVVPATPQNVAALAAGTLRVRQRPGDDNALGLVKFIFPNEYNVYMHGTPAQKLFQESRRDFSHGCIRVADPAGLAAYVLRDANPAWTHASIEAAMNGAATRRVKLEHPVRVMILYGTALATEAGQIMFFDDIYGHDHKLEQLLGLQPA